MGGAPARAPILHGSIPYLRAELELCAPRVPCPATSHGGTDSPAAARDETNFSCSSFIAAAPSKG